MISVTFQAEDAASLRIVMEAYLDATAPTPAAAAAGGKVVPMKLVDAATVGQQDEARSEAPSEAEEPAPVASKAEKPKTTRTAKKAKEPEAPPLDRQAIIEGLTQAYQKGDDKTRAQIVAFRDSNGAKRLRELKDEAMAEAADLLKKVSVA